MMILRSPVALPSSLLTWTPLSSAQKCCPTASAMLLASPATFAAAADARRSAAAARVPTLGDVRLPVTW